MESGNSIKKSLPETIVKDIMSKRLINIFWNNSMPDSKNDGIGDRDSSHKKGEKPEGTSTDWWKNKSGHNRFYYLIEDQLCGFSMC